mgnify:CR=1 FL=1
MSRQVLKNSLFTILNSPFPIVPSLPPRDNRVLQTVDFLKKEMMSGRLTGLLPGERELCKRFRVSRVTLRKAMQILEDEKWISVSTPGCRRQTLKHGKSDISIATDCVGKTVVVLSPHDLGDLPGMERLHHTRLNSYCSRAGITLMHRALDLTQLKRPAYRLQEFIKQNPADIYLLLLSSKETQQWFFNNNIPCIVLGSVWDDHELPSADTDQKALGVHVASTLIRLGHKRVGMLYPEPEKRGMQMFVKSLEDTSPEMNLIKVKQDDSPESVMKALLSLVADEATRPSVIILPRLTYAAMATGLMPSLGLKIPEQVSLICLVHDESLLFCHPQVAGYGVPEDAYPKAIFNLVVKRLLHPDTKELEHALVMPNFIQAESLVRRGS